MLPRNKYTLPPDYKTIISHGVKALREVEVELRDRLSGEDSDELWRELRDVSGLADRLAPSENETTESEWESGSIRFHLSPLDIQAVSFQRLRAPSDRAAPLAALERFLSTLFDSKNA